MSEIITHPGGQQEAPDDNADHRLVDACVRGDFERAIQLVREGNCNVNDGDVAGRRPLHFAAGSAQHELTRLLIEAHADVNCSASEGSTPLHLAAGLHLIPKLHLTQEEFEHVHEGVKMLLEHGADHRIQNRFGCTPLHTALYMASHAVSQGPLPMATVDSYVTRIVQTLIDNGAEVNCQDNDGCTPLHYASDSGFLAVIRMLLQNGASVNLANKEKKTALHYACNLSNLEAARILAEFHADPTLTNDRGQTPLDCLPDSSQRPLFETLFAPQQSPQLLPANSDITTQAVSQTADMTSPVNATEPTKDVEVVDPGKKAGRSCCTIL